MDDDARRELLRSLTPREREFADLVASGRSNQFIREALHVAPKTLDRHLSNIYAKLDLPAHDPAVHRRVMLTRLLQAPSDVARPDEQRA